MKFDRFTVGLLMRRPDAPKLDALAESELQNAHMSFLSRLHTQGHLLAAGPFLRPTHENPRGLAIYRGSPDEAARLASADPAVRGGVLTLQFYPWLVPAGAIAFSRTAFPTSMAEVRDG